MISKKSLFILTVTFFIAACGSGSSNNPVSNTSTSSIGSSKNSTANSDVNPPSAAIIFPPAVSMTEFGSVLVRGSASDDKNKISSVKVNGYEVTTTNNYVNWMVNVPLNPGMNKLTVSAVDVVGNTTNNAAEIKIARGDGLPTGGNVYYSPLNLLLDKSSNRLFLMEEYPTTLYALDLNTGTQTIISKIEENHGLNNYNGIVLDAAQNRMLVADSVLGGVTAINLDSGTRSMFWKGINNDGAFPLSIVLDSARNRIIVTDATNSPECIISVDITNGVSSPVPNNTPSDSSPISCLSPIALDSPNNRVLSAEYNTKAIVAIDLITGNRTTLSNNNIPDDVNPFSSPIAITVDTTHNRALVVDGGNVLSVDLTSGKRALITEDNSGIAAYAQTITIDETKNIAFLIDNRLRAVVVMDLTNGHRVIFSK